MICRWLNPWMWNHEYGGPAMKLDLDCMEGWCPYQRCSRVNCTYNNNYDGEMGVGGNNSARENGQAPPEPSDQS